MSKISFTHTQSPFFRTLKTKVDTYFTSQQIRQTGNTSLLVKGIVQILSAILIYTVLVFFTPPLLISIVLCILLGFNLAFIGFNITHEGGHQSFSKHKWINTTASYCLNVLGGNSYYWKIKHNINHHTYTNIEGIDSDIDIKPFMRLHADQPRYWLHRFQYLYWFVLYGVSYLAWILYDDFQKYITGKVTVDRPSEKLTPKEHLIFWTTKLFYIGIYLVLPIYMVGWVPALIGFAIFSFVSGLAISIVFQLAHIVEDTQFPSPDATTSKINQEWAVHQIQTTANFATHNRVLSWFLGGLNFQVEHHLFPRISHVHYPKINQFVKETCREYNITYLEYSSMFKAFQSHLVHIKKMGTVN